jgi:hypothetical protein
VQRTSRLWSVALITPRLVSGWIARNRVSVPIILALLTAVLAWIRLPAVARDTLWAEDGRNFLQDALNVGPLNSLVIPYAGYLHTFPRIVASLTVQFVPVQFFALSMTFGACLLAGIMAAIVYVCSADVVAWMPARVLIASLTVLAPLAPREVLGNMANLHSLVLWTMLWVLLYRPRSRAGSIAIAVFVLLGTTTEIASVFLLPLLLWRPRDRSRWLVRGTFLVGVAAQLLVTLIWRRGQTGNPPLDFWSIPYGYLINAVAPLWIPQNSIGASIAWGGPLLCIALALPFAIAAVITLRRGSSIQRVAATALIAGSVVIYSASVVENPNVFYDYARLSATQLHSVWLARYGVVPSMMLCALVPLAAGITIARRTSTVRSAAIRRGAIVAPAVLGLVVLLLVQFIPQGTRRSYGPEWQPQVSAARGECANLPDAQTVRLRETINWSVTVPCGLLE